jgi:hypothetical protein
MRQFARHRHAWRVKRVKEVWGREPSGVCQHYGPELSVAHHRAQDPQAPGQLSQPCAMNRGGAGANACGPRRAGWRGMK